MSIKNMIKAGLKRWLDSDGGTGGASVVSGPAGVLAVEVGADSRTAILTGMSGRIGEASLVAQDGGMAKLEVKMAGSVVYSDVAPANVQEKQFESWVKRFSRMTKGAKSGGGMFKWAALVCGVLVAMTWFGMRAPAAGVAAAVASGASSTGTPITVPELLAQVQAQSTPPRSTGVPLVAPGGLPDPGDDDKIFPIASLTDAQVKEVKTAHLLELKGDGQPFYIFSNPTCTACQHLEGELGKLKGGQKPVVIPVAFDAEGMRRGTLAMCAPDPVAAWKKMMAGEKIDTPLCLDGLKKMERNSNLFASLGFQATPTVIAADGRGSIGSVSSGVLANWLIAKN